MQNSPNHAPQIAKISAHPPQNRRHEDFPRRANPAAITLRPATTKRGRNYAL
ncbi:hypothetical protein FC18_GL001678 [Lacticaseibacillus sharpeae JCM 1186 = DSM 20505]|uniref:Uncharacterized protein n=1 Tax=Lacticaseibacillus sharpeae JCM 1186 = DSM 20505 TaxID=1291052 RepID=A0A0R1ZTJ6_9LACO|nr:hypothetical protein FC18_GL001678 [Lacticaseibacillus sharpeae JCM 1186 = DSM 20505]